MCAATVARWPSGTADYQARLACAGQDWSAIEKAYLSLQVQDSTKYHPGFFLAQVCPFTWHPTIILVYGPDQAPAGMMFLKERKVHGIRTGLFFGDSSLGFLITSKAHEEQHVFRAAMATLLRSRLVNGLRLFTGTSGYEPATLKCLPIPRHLKGKLVPTECHQVLTLAPTYEQFLTVLSYKTRRNFRYFRNKSGNAGHSFTGSLSMEEFVPAAWKLQSERTVGGHFAPLERAIAVLKTARRPLLVALKSAEDEMLSFAGGWWEGTRAVVFMQLNSDKRHPKESLSLTLRTYLIEYLIENGCTEIVWWSGVSEPIKHYCKSVPTVAICLDNQGLLWRAGRRLLESARARLPKRYHALADMVVAPSLAVGQHADLISVPESL